MKLYIIILVILVIILIFFQESESFNNVSLSGIPILVISNPEKFKQSYLRLKLLGFKTIRRVPPIYLKNDTICKTRKVGLSELGCIEAHKSCFREVLKLRTPCIILEEDWDYTLASDIFSKKIINYYQYYLNNSLDLLWLGHCGDACMHAYIIGPKSCKYILGLDYCNTPVDLKLYKLCREQKLKCYKVKNDNTNKNYFGGGLIIQDRKNNIGMHDHTNKRTKMWF